MIITARGLMKEGLQCWEQDLSTMRVVAQEKFMSFKLLCKPLNLLRLTQDQNTQVWQIFRAWMPCIHNSGRIESALNLKCVITFFDIIFICLNDWFVVFKCYQLNLCNWFKNSGLVDRDSFPFLCLMNFQCINWTTWKWLNFRSKWTLIGN